MLKPIKTPTPLEIGTLYHYGLEQLLNGRSAVDAAADLLEIAHASAEEKGIDYDPMNVYIAIEMARAWDRDSNWRSWKIEAVEKQFEVTTGYAKRLLGKIDGIITHPGTGKPYLIEHKTTGMWGNDGTKYLENLLWDEQSTNYLYAYRRMLEDGILTGAAVEGIFYDIIEKPSIKPYTATPPEKRKYTRDGMLYSNMHETDESAEDYRKRVRAWYEEKNRIHTAFVYRTPADIEEHIRDFNLTVKDIVSAEREGTWYRNPAACAVLACPYRPKCLDNVPDTDCLFTRKQSKNEELDQ